MTEKHELPFSDSTGKKVLLAFDPKDPSWRTPGGIAMSSSTTESEVETYIREHRDWFEESSLRPGGVKGYRPRKDVLHIVTKEGVTEDYFEDWP